MRKLASYQLFYEEVTPKFVKIAEKKRGRPIKYLELKDFEKSGSVLSNPSEAKK